MQFHGRVVSALVEGWNEERGDRGRTIGRRNHAFEGECAQRIASFVLKAQATNALALCEPLFAAVGDHPRDIAQFVRSPEIRPVRAARQIASVSGCECVGIASLRPCPNQHTGGIINFGSALLSCPIEPTVRAEIQWHS